MKVYSESKLCGTDKSQLTQLEQEKNKYIKDLTIAVGGDMTTW